MLPAGPAVARGAPDRHADPPLGDPVHGAPNLGGETAALDTVTAWTAPHASGPSRASTPRRRPTHPTDSPPLGIWPCSRRPTATSPARLPLSPRRLTVASKRKGQARWPAPRRSKRRR